MTLTVNTNQNNIVCTLGDLLTAIDIRLSQSEQASLPILDMQLDSRQVSAGSLFIALQGTQEHGLCHAKTAVKSGAIAVLWEKNTDSTGSTESLGINLPDVEVPLIAVEQLSQQLGVLAARFYQAPSSALQIIGITGTDGKTSVSHFLAHVLNQEKACCALIGTIAFGLPNAWQKATHTTPNAIRLQALLAEYRSAQADYVSMEVSSHALDQGRVNAVQFDLAVLTNLSRDHLDYHKTVQAYADAKAALFVWPSLKRLILNWDDPFSLRLAKAAQVDVFAYGIGSVQDFPEGSLVAEQVAFSGAGLSANIRWQGQQATLAAPVLGRFNVSNLLAVLAVLLCFDWSLKQAVSRLNQVKTVRGRMEIVSQQKEVTVVVDYAHTPGALEQALSALRDHCHGELLCVFGCGGDRDVGKRPLMAAVAERLADTVILTDDNPRTEAPEKIMKALRDGLKYREKVIVEHNRARAIGLAVRKRKQGDVVLIAGKGHETTQIYADKVMAFDDREQVQRILQEQEG